MAEVEGHPEGCLPLRGGGDGRRIRSARQEQVQHLGIATEGSRVEKRPPTRLPPEVDIEASVQQLLHPGNIAGEYLAPYVIVVHLRRGCGPGRPVTDERGQRDDRQQAEQERERHPT